MSSGFGMGIFNSRTRDLRIKEVCMNCSDFGKSDLATLRLCRQCYKWNGKKMKRIWEEQRKEVSLGHYDEEIIRRYLNMGMSLESAKSRAWVEDEKFEDEL